MKFPASGSLGCGELSVKVEGEPAAMLSLLPGDDDVHLYFLFEDWLEMYGSVDSNGEWSLYLYDAELGQRYVLGSGPIRPTQEELSSIYERACWLAYLVLEYDEAREILFLDEPFEGMMAAFLEELDRRRGVVTPWSQNGHDEAESDDTGRTGE
jgi:hypothetical protein